MGKKHPLDVFRNSATGFDSASRERRTMLGRVVASAPRAPVAPAAPATAPAGLPPAVAATRERALAASAPAFAPGPVAPAAPAPLVTRERPPGNAGARPLQPPAIPMLAERRAAEPRTPDLKPAELRPADPKAPRAAAPREAGPRDGGPASAAGRPLPSRINRVLLVSACVLVGGLALWTVAASFGTPSLKNNAPVGSAAPALFRVQAASWPGTPAGHATAISARSMLQSQGFKDIDVLAWPGSAPDSFVRFDLVVGKAGSEAGLADTCKKLKDIKNWPGSVKQPFKDAAVVKAAVQ